MSQLSIGRKVSASKVKRFHSQKCLEFTPQPFPTQSYVGKGNAPFTRKTQELRKLLSGTPSKIDAYKQLVWVVSNHNQTFSNMCFFILAVLYFS